VSRRGRRLGTLKARTYTFDFEINPRADTFEGPLAVLVDGGSASTAEIFAAGLQDLGRARVFGTKTAGAALPSTIIRLPNGDGLQYAEATYTSRNGLVLEGAGVTPDVLVKHTRESLLAGKDAALDAAVDWIKSKKSGAN
jgi:carboxyl-terminal processing protease